MNLGLIGYGAIGQLLARAIHERRGGDVSLAAVLDVYEDPPFEQSEEGLPAYTTSIDNFLSQELDVVVEAASQSVLKAYALQIVNSGRHLVPMSVGAFSDLSFLEDLSAAAMEHNCRVLLPSGAIGGLDALSAAANDEIDTVTLTTRKPLRALEGVRSTIDPELDLGTITEPTLIYEGPATEAVVRYPKNVNVAAALSLAGIGFDKTTVRIVADPEATRNVHRVEVEGKFGRLSLELENYPAPTNPKTSYLAALSAIQRVKNLTAAVRVGT